MMQAKLTHRSRYLAGKFTYALILCRMGENDQSRTVYARHNVTGPSQASAHSLADAAQAGVGRMPAKDIDIRIKVIKREQYE